MSANSQALPLSTSGQPALLLRPRVVARRGALLASKAVAGYGLAFLLLSAVRYTFSVLAAPPDTGLWATVAAGVTSLALSTLVMCLICALVAVPCGALTALAVARLIRWYDLHCPPVSGALIGGGFGLALVCALHALLAVNGLWSTASVASPTSLFWLELPALIYVGMCAYGGWQYARLLRAPAAAGRA